MDSHSSNGALLSDRPRSLPSDAGSDTADVLEALASSTFPDANDTIVARVLCTARGRGCSYVRGILSNTDTIADTGLEEVFVQRGGERRGLLQTLCMSPAAFTRWCEREGVTSAEQRALKDELGVRESDDIDYNTLAALVGRPRQVEHPLLLSATRKLLRHRKPSARPQRRSLLALVAECAEEPAEVDLTTLAARIKECHDTPHGRLTPLLRRTRQPAPPKSPRERRPPPLRSTIPRPVSDTARLPSTARRFDVPSRYMDGYFASERIVHSKGRSTLSVRRPVLGIAAPAGWVSDGRAPAPHSTKRWVRRLPQNTPLLS